MNTELTKQVIENLEKSGFSSELRSIRTFLNGGWRCTGFANYLDLDQEQVRAVDLRASKTIDRTLHDNVRISVDYYLDGEVKKSEKPWVVFKEELEHIIDDHINNLTHVCGVAPYKLRNVMPLHSLHTNLGWRAYGVHESFKRPDAPSRAYSSFITACKSAESTLGTASAYYKEIEQDAKNSDERLDHRAVVMVKPVIILDGILIAASLSEDGQINIEEVPFAPLEFIYRSKHCRKGIYLIDIVTLSHLQDYLEHVSRRHNALFGAL